MYSKKSRKKKMITISIIIFLSLFLLLYSLSSSRKLGPLESFFKDTSILIQKVVMFPFTYLNSEKYRVSILSSGAHILNYKTIVDITSDEAIIKIDKKIIKIYGTSLKLIKLDKKELLINGVIKRLEINEH